MQNELDDARQELFIHIADKLRTMPEFVKEVYLQLVDEGFIDYDTEKEILLYGEEE